MRRTEVTVIGSRNSALPGPLNRGLERNTINKMTYRFGESNPVVGVTVQMCDENNMCTKAGATDSDGKVVIEREEAAWKVQVDGIDDKFPFDSNNTVTITKP